MGSAPPLELASVTDDIAGHYRYAERHQTDFAAIPCFCGCEEFLSHENLYDCFIRTDGAGFDSHAAGCGVCIGEAVVASQLLDAGTPATDVPDRLDRKRAVWGHSVSVREDLGGRRSIQ